MTLTTSGYCISESGSSIIFIAFSLSPPAMPRTATKRGSDKSASPSPSSMGTGAGAGVGAGAGAGAGADEIEAGSLLMLEDLPML